MKTVVLVSGGLDSVTLAHYLAAQGGARPLLLVSADYGQRHRVELDYARRAGIRLDADRHYLLPMGWLADLLHGSALTGGAVPVPHGHYAAETMRATVVPNRNMILLALAGGIAVAEGATVVATAVHAGDHAIYPDCRPDFVDAMDHTLRVATQGFAPPGFRLEAPFVHQTKADIVRLGAKLGVPFAETWSCYEGGAVHCGACGTCVERREAFALAGVADPTEYAADAPALVAP